MRFISMRFPHNVSIFVCTLGRLQNTRKGNLRRWIIGSVVAMTIVSGVLTFVIIGHTYHPIAFYLVTIVVLSLGALFISSVYVLVKVSRLAWSRRGTSRRLR